MQRRRCRRHGGEEPCSCAMGNLYRFIEPVVLQLLRDRGAAHGYELGKALEDHALTDSIVDLPALYRVLRTLEMNGFVTSEWDVTGRGPARHLYRLTPAGRLHLEDWLVVLEKLAGSLATFVQEARESTRGTDR